MSIPTAVVPQIDTSTKARDFTSRSGLKPLVIVLHHTGGTNSLAWLAGNANQTSSHVLVTKHGLIHRMVPDELGANTVGYSVIGNYRRTDPEYRNCNKISLNIEIENIGNGKDPYTDEQYNAVGWQIVEWRKKYGWLFILSHGLIDTKGKNDAFGLDWELLERYIFAHMRYSF